MPAELAIDGEPLTEDERMFLMALLLDAKDKQNLLLMRYSARGTDPNPDYAARAQASYDTAVDLISRMSGVPVSRIRQHLKHMDAPFRVRKSSPKRS